MTAAESFIAEIETYLERTGVSPTAFGKAVVGDPCFVADLKNGRMPGLRLVEKVRQYIASNNSPKSRSRPAAASAAR